MVPEKPRVLYLDPQAAGDCVTGHNLSIYETSKPIPRVKYFLQQGHTYSNKAIPCNSATSYMPHNQTHESREAEPLQTTTTSFYPLKEAKAGSEDGNLKAETEAYAMEKSRSLAPMACFACLLILSRTTCPGLAPLTVV